MLNGYERNPTCTSNQLPRSRSGGVRRSRPGGVRRSHPGAVEGKEIGRRAASRRRRVHAGGRGGVQKKR
jgi:hypothetical protein